MRKERLASAQKVKDLRTGVYYAVTGPDTIAQIDRNDEIVEGGETVVITESNARCFSTVKWAPEGKPVGYDISNGIIVKDGAPVTEQGSIEAVSILGAFLGTIVFIGKLDDRNWIYTYRPSTNRFVQIRPIDRELKMIDYKVIELEDSLIVGINAYKMVEEPDEKDPEKTVEVERFDQATVERIYQKYSDKTEVSAPIDYSLIQIVGDTLYVGISRDKDGNSIPTEYEYFDLSDMADGVAILTDTPALIGESQLGVVFVCDNKIITDSQAIKTAEAAELKRGGFKYIIDECENVHDNVYTLILANENREVRTVTRKRTADRGDIVSITA